MTTRSMRLSVYSPGLVVLTLLQRITLHLDRAATGTSVPTPKRSQPHTQAFSLLQLAIESFLSATSGAPQRTRECTTPVRYRLILPKPWRSVTASIVARVLMGDVYCAELQQWNAVYSSCLRTDSRVAFASMISSSAA